MNRLMKSHVKTYMSSTQHSVRRMLTFPAVYIYTVWHEESDAQVKIERSLRLDDQN